MSRTIDELIRQAAARLAELGYAPGTIERFNASWNVVRRWCRQQDIEYFAQAEEHQLLAELGLTDNVLSPRQRGMLRHIRTLLSLNDHGRLPRFSKPAPEEVPERFQHIFVAYQAHLKARGLAVTTQRGLTSILRKFLIGLKIEDFGSLSMDDVTAHIEACSSMTAQTRSGILYAIRALTQWAAEQGFCSGEVAAAMPVIAGHTHATLPSAYAVSDVAAMVAAAGGQSAKRDRAMLLLASVLGLRASDLRALRLADIDWRTSEIRLTQSKTGNSLRLPLPEEVMLALVDYLRNERPDHTSDHVFLHHRAPHHSFADTSNAFHYVTTNAYDRAAVNTAGKHHGMHSLRHSAATNMLSDGTGYPVISGILGHSNANTTRKYLAIDVERLRALSLEVPRG